MAVPSGDGAYSKETGPHGGTVYIVLGSSGRLAAGPLDHPATAAVQATYGCGQYWTSTEDRLDAQFVNRDGVALDNFTIVKTGLLPHPTATSTQTPTPTATSTSTATPTATSTLLPLQHLLSANSDQHVDSNADKYAFSDDDSNRSAHTYGLAHSHHHCHT